MAYKIFLPPKMMKDLWRLREYCGAPSIIEQVRSGVKLWIEKKETEIGTSIEDATEAIEQEEKYEQRGNQI